jgi:hypothetical protein
MSKSYLRAILYFSFGACLTLIAVIYYNVKPTYVDRNLITQVRPIDTEDQIKIADKGFGDLKLIQPFTDVLTGPGLGPLYEIHWQGTRINIPDKLQVRKIDRIKLNRLVNNKVAPYFGYSEHVLAKYPESKVNQISFVYEDEEKLVNFNTDMDKNRFILTRKMKNESKDIKEVKTLSDDKLRKIAESFLIGMKIKKSDPAKSYIGPSKKIQFENYFDWEVFEKFNLKSVYWPKIINNEKVLDKNGKYVRVLDIVIDQNTEKVIAYLGDLNTDYTESDYPVLKPNKAIERLLKREIFLEYSIDSEYVNYSSKTEVVYDKMKLMYLKNKTSNGIFYVPVYVFEGKMHYKTGPSELWRAIVGAIEERYLTKL